MTTATISLSPTGRPTAGRSAPAGRSATAGRTTPAGATPASALSTTRAAVLSVLGSMLAIGVAAIGVLVVALVSSALPARRATRVAPVEGLASLD